MCNSKGREKKKHINDEKIPIQITTIPSITDSCCWFSVSDVKHLSGDAYQVMQQELLQSSWGCWPCVEQRSCSFHHLHNITLCTCLHRSVMMMKASLLHHPVQQGTGSATAAYLQCSPRGTHLRRSGTASIPTGTADGGCMGLAFQSAGL